jgi:hypothetical protein
MMFGSWKIILRGMGDFPHFFRGMGDFPHICFALMLLAFSNASADTKYEPLLLVRGARPMGLGNAFEAIADDENAFHYNPAGLAQRDEILFHLLIARPRISSDLASESTEIQDLLDNIETLRSYSNWLENSSQECREAREELADWIEEAATESLGARSDLPSIGLAVPFRIAEKYKLTVGGSVYTQSLISLCVEPRGLIWADPIKDMLDDAIVYNFAAQWAWEIASAVEFPVNKPPILSKVYTGVALRRINRWVFTDEDDPFTVDDLMNLDGPDGIEGTDDDFAKRYFDIENFDFDYFRDNSEQRKGYSIDLGTILVPVDGLKCAFVIRNLVSSISLEEENSPHDRYFPRNMVLSAAVKPLTFLSNPVSLLDLTLAASLDRRNSDDRMLDFSVNKYTDRIHLGTEITIFPNRDISFSGRIGNNQGFLTFGASLKLSKLHLDFVRYGDLEADWYVGYINFRF